MLSINKKITSNIKAFDVLKSTIQLNYLNNAIVVFYGSSRLVQNNS